MVELLSSINPLSIPLFGILAYSALMLPLGILLPCGKCCGGCLLCDAGSLPATVTVTVSGFPSDGWNCCGEVWNGKEIVLKQLASNPCVYEGWACMTTGQSSVRVSYNGPSSYPTVTITDSNSYYIWSPAGNTLSHVCGKSLTSTTLITDCDNFAFTATDGTVTASVSPGGNYATLPGDPGYTGASVCHSCCRGGEAPEEITITTPHPFTNETTDFVLPMWSNKEWRIGVSDGAPPYDSSAILRVYLRECVKAECVNCWKACETVVHVVTRRYLGISTGQVNNIPWGDGRQNIYYYERGQGTSWYSCDHCTTYPLCGPTSGDYALYPWWYNNAAAEQDLSASTSSVTIH